MPLPKGLVTEVKNYLATHVYSGFEKPFELKRLAAGPNAKDRVWVVPKRVARDIEEPDEGWERGLAELGKKMGIELVIDPFVYY